MPDPACGNACKGVQSQPQTCCTRQLRNMLEIEELTLSKTDGRASLRELTLEAMQAGSKVWLRPSLLLSQLKHCST